LKNIELYRLIEKLVGWSSGHAKIFFSHKLPQQKNPRSKKKSATKFLEIEFL